MYNPLFPYDDDDYDDYDDEYDDYDDDWDDEDDDWGDDDDLDEDDTRTRQGHYDFCRPQAG